VAIARESQNSKALAVALFSLGHFYRLEHREFDAVSALQLCLSVDEKIFGPDDVGTGEVVAELAATYAGVGALNEARPYLDRLRPMAGKFSGPERDFVDHLLAQDAARESDAAALARLTARAAAGDSEAEFELGVASELGRGVPQDYVAARQHYLAAAAKGNAHAMSGLGVLYDKGHGVAVDDGQAASWYRRAADAGYMVAEYNLGIFLIEGRGTKADIPLALEYLKKADAQGYPGAKRAIAVAQKRLADQTK
jgi:TPR repeat protein